MFVSASLALALFATPFASASPVDPRRNDTSVKNNTVTVYPDTPPSNCSLSGVTLSLPPGQTALTEPVASPSLVAIGVGYQHYVCKPAGWEWAGVEADLFDISCELGKPLAGNLSDPNEDELLLNIVATNGPIVTLNSVNTNMGILPRFTGAYDEWSSVYGTYKEAASLPSPINNNSIPWRELQLFEGNLSNWVYQVDTVSGQAPPRCDTRKDTRVRLGYAAFYYFY